MTNRKSTKGQAMICKTLQRKSKIKLKPGAELRCSERVGSACSTSDTCVVRWQTCHSDTFSSFRVNQCLLLFLNTMSLVGKQMLDFIVFRLIRLYLEPMIYCAPKANMLIIIPSTRFEESKHLNTVGFRVMVLNATFNNISVIVWRSVLLVGETAVHGEYHQPVASL